MLIYDENRKLVSSNYNLDDFSFLLRSGTKSSIEETALELLPKIKRNNSYVIVDQIHNVNFTIYGSIYENYIIIITNDKYPKHLGYQLLNELRNKRTYIQTFKLYQNVDDVDKIAVVNKELDETKAILLNSIDKLLQRGESIKDLIAKTEDLKEASKNFGDEVKKLNKCCNLL